MRCTNRHNQANKKDIQCDDIQCVLNSSEVAIALFADYSNALDTICYGILLKKF